MRDDSPSRTAAWVALARAMGRDLPPEAQLADDPYGAAFEHGPRLHHLLSGRGVRVHRLPGVTSWILYMQVRTRVIDDALRAFVAGGGRQVVVLGAGYDCRALRLPELADSRVLEIDHPATQGHKRAVLERIGAASPAHYVTWDFETRPMEDLPEVLAEAGLDVGAARAPAENAPSPSPLGCTIMIPSASQAFTNSGLELECPGRQRFPPAAARSWRSRHCCSSGTAVPSAGES